MIERAVIPSRDRRLSFDLPRTNANQPPVAREAAPSESSADEEVSLDELELRQRAVAHAALTRTKWKIHGADGAAALLKVKPTTLASMIKRLNLSRPTA